MKKLNKFVFSFVLLLGTLSFFNISLAADASNPADLIPIPSVSTIRSLSDVQTKLQLLVIWFANIFWILTIGFIIYAAYLFLSAGDNDDQIKTAKSMVQYSLIAAAVALLATGISSIAGSILKGGS